MILVGIGTNFIVKEYENPWTFRGEPFLDPKGYTGFVYLITNEKTGKKYIGRKYFFRRKKVSGKRATWVASDWRNYYGSSSFLHEDIVKQGASTFKREILSLHETRGAVNYHEVREQFFRDVLRSEDYYNDAIARFRNVSLNSSIFAEE